MTYLRAGRENTRVRIQSYVWEIKALVTWTEGAINTNAGQPGRTRMRKARGDSFRVGIVPDDV